MKACANASERTLVCASVVFATRTHGGGLVGRACRSESKSVRDSGSNGAAKTVMGASSAEMSMAMRILDFETSYGFDS